MLDEALDALAREGYKDVCFVTMPGANDYQNGRNRQMVVVCETDPYPGDPAPLYAWGTDRGSAAEALFALIVKLHPPSEH